MAKKVVKFCAEKTASDCCLYDFFLNMSGSLAEHAFGKSTFVYISEISAQTEK